MTYTDAWALARQHSETYLAMAGRVQDTKLNDLTKAATVAAIGLAASCAAADHVAPLLAALDTATAELDRIREQRTDPGMLRWCDWPRCVRSYCANPGPHESGWTRGRLLLCPTHSVSGHMPRLEYLSEHSGVVAHCECGTSRQFAPHTPSGAIWAWWEDHVIEEGTPEQHES